MIKALLLRSVIGKIIPCPIILLFVCNNVLSQDPQDSSALKYLYRPQAVSPKDTVPVPDSVLLREQFIRDSIEARQAYLRDSIIAREKFVRDSIERRQRILDSLNFLKAELPRLLEATVYAASEFLVVHMSGVRIVGDSMLSDYTYEIVPFNLYQPYTPWRSTLNLSDNPLKIITDRQRRKILSIKAPDFECSYLYSKNNPIVITGKGMVSGVSGTSYFKVPVDSVFHDRSGRIVKVKRYHCFYKLLTNYQQGTLMHVYLSQVKQYEYSTTGQLSKFWETNFCAPNLPLNPVKVCNAITYSLGRQGTTYFVTKQNNPSNAYSDGLYTVEFDGGFNPGSMSFTNTSKTEDWNCFIELNDAGNVGRYLYQKNGVVSETLLVNYFDNDPFARHKFETITCIFEPDGISYKQINNTTGKSRVRDKLTMEWSPWR